MAQDFTLRYPLIDGIGNFGSRDGDGAAAMRYTEARLTPIAELLLSEINQGTVDFMPNYDGAFDEPLHLPARLPMVLLNGASGIAVGMATEIPSHNLNEVTQAAIALLKKPTLETADLMQYIPAPDFAGGGQIITPADELRRIYETGKGSVRVRARYEIEKLARGQWRVIVTELPPNANSAKILAEIEEQTNPKPKAGKKQLNQDRLNTKKLMLDLIDRVRDESDGEHPVRLVFEPKSSRIDTDTFINTLMAQTSLEGNVSMNLVMMGLDNRPAQKNLKTILQEWLDFRVVTVTRRLKFRLNQVEKRLHILKGRLKVFLHIDEVIKVIRESDDPKADLMAVFGLTEIQAEDILEIRLRQLARLEGFKLEKELNELREEQGRLNIFLGDENEKRKLIIKEMQADMKQFGDARRTLVEKAGRAVLTQTAADEPITLILSEKGWIRSRAGHNLDLSQTAFKEGDRLKQTLEGRTVLPVVILRFIGQNLLDRCRRNPRRTRRRRTDFLLNRVAKRRETRRDVDRIAGTTLFIIKQRRLRLYRQAGRYGRTRKSGQSGDDRRQRRNRPAAGCRLCLSFINPDCKIIAATSQNRALAFPIGELKIMAKGKGLQIIGLNAGESMTHTAVSSEPEILIESEGRRGAAHKDRLPVALIEAKRGKKGRLLPISGSLKQLSSPK